MIKWILGILFFFVLRIPSQANSQNICSERLSEIRKAFDAKNSAIFELDMTSIECPDSIYYTAFYFQGFAHYFRDELTDAIVYWDLAREYGGPWDEQLLFQTWMAYNKLGDVDFQNLLTEELIRKYPKSSYLKKVKEVDYVKDSQKLSSTSSQSSYLHVWDFSQKTILDIGGEWSSGEFPSEGGRLIPRLKSEWVQIKNNLFFIEGVGLEYDRSLENREDPGYELGLYFVGNYKKSNIFVSTRSYPGLKSQAAFKKEQIDTNQIFYTFHSQEQPTRIYELLMIGGTSFGLTKQATVSISFTATSILDYLNGFSFPLELKYTFGSFYWANTASPGINQASISFDCEPSSNSNDTLNLKMCEEKTNNQEINFQTEIGGRFGNLSFISDLEYQLSRNTDDWIIKHKRNFNLTSSYRVNKYFKFGSKLGVEKSNIRAAMQKYFGGFVTLQY